MEELTEKAMLLSGSSLDHAHLSNTSTILNSMQVATRRTQNLMQLDKHVAFL